MNNIVKQVYIYKDQRNAIIITPDSYKGISIQVIRFVSQLKPNFSNELVETTTIIPIWSKTIPTIEPSAMDQFSKNPSMSIKPVNGDTFKRDIKTAIEESKSYLSKINSLDSMIDGSLNDYLSQNSEINKAQ